MLNTLYFNLNKNIFNLLNKTTSLNTSKKVLSCKYSTCLEEKKKLKVYTDFTDAIQDIHSGAKVLVGGYGLCGIPENLIKALMSSDIKDLTIVSNNCGTDKFGLGLLLKQKKIKRLIASHIGENSEAEKQYLSGELELEITPQGTLAEKLRAAGAGIPAFFTPASYGTLIQQGEIAVKYKKDGKVELQSGQKQAQLFNGKPYVLEEAIYGDFALIKAKQADTAGNLIFSKAARNFNPTMAKAAKITIAEVEEIVELGTIKPDSVHLPGIYVDRVIKGDNYEKRIEKITVAQLNSKVDSIIKRNPAAELRERILRRLALEFKDGMYINLSGGLPMMAVDYIPKNSEIFLHSENGIIGIGSFPNPNCVDADLINASKETITIVPGASFFSSDESFDMIRGGHLNIAVVGANEVSQYGDLASWMIPGEVVKGIPPAMDLVTAPRTKIIVCMEHSSKDGAHKIVENCTLPLTGVKCVDMIITEKAVFDVNPENGLTLLEVAEGVHIEDVLMSTGCEFQVAESLKPMAQVAI